MAAPSTTIDNDDDDEFDDYNPHPYQGGYDIALTYGHPHPPSTSTCYPVPGGSGHLPKPRPPAPPPESGHRPDPPAPIPLPPPPTSPESGHSPEPSTPPPPSPESGHRPEPSTPPPLPPPLESGHRPKPPSTPPTESSHRPEPDYRPVNYWPWPDFDNFGFWPYYQTECQRCCADGEGLGYWHQLKRAGDYLFGYSEGYGERRIGVDSYGIPIYANKKEGSEAVTVEIEPARDMKVVCYESENDNGNWFSPYNEKNDRSYGYAYNKHDYDEPLHAQENSIEPMLHQQLTYHEAYEEQVYPKLERWFSPYNEKNDRSYGYAYNKHDYEQPLHAQENLIEPMLHQQLTYHEAYEEQVYPKLERWPSSYEEVDRSYAYAYNKHQYEESLHVEESLVEPTLYQRLAYHAVYDEQSYSKLETRPSYGEDDGETSLYGNNQYACERYDKEQPLCVELEPYKPTWSQNLHNVEFYGGESSLVYISHSSMDNVVGDKSSIFGESNGANGKNSYEQPVCVQLEPYKSTWAQNPTFYQSYGQEVSQPSWLHYVFLTIRRYRLITLSKKMEPSISVPYLNTHNTMNNASLPCVTVLRLAWCSLVVVMINLVNL